MSKSDHSLLVVLTLIALPAVKVLAQDDVIVGDDGSDAYLRSVTDAAQLLQSRVAAPAHSTSPTGTSNSWRSPATR